AVAAGRVEIDALEQEALARVHQAKTALDGARKQYDRALALQKKGSISQQNFDDMDTAHALAIRNLETTRTTLGVFPAKRLALEARLNVLDRQLQDGTITAPRNGTVVEKYAEAGERTAAGKPIIKLAALDRVWVKIYVGEADLGKVRLGAAAKIEVDSHPGIPFNGTVIWVSDQSEFTPKNVQTRDARADLVYAVKVDIPNPDRIFKIGMPVDVSLQGFPEFETPDSSR
ncbi:efflux RND transporter periplasmic adaptor subunit, partial [bacterium]|nr:efflux RND transporter periplasmic adaptor subunit [candidate division CSSED10-310 bacterium]